MSDNEKADSDKVNEIMAQITAGLTGDSATDIRYLRAKAIEYKDHPLGKEIVRACGRLMYEAMPEEDKEKLSTTLRDDDRAMESRLEEVRSNLLKKDFEAAYRQISALAKEVEDLHHFHDDAVSEYRLFNEPFEEALYYEIYKPAKDVRHPSIPYTDIYLLYGSTLIDLNRLDEARDQLKKGLAWNPVDFTAASEYVETFRIAGDMETFYKETLRVFPLAFRPAHVARLYRNLGYYFTEKELFDVATGCYTMSVSFERSKQAENELLYIIQKNNGTLPAISPDDFAQCAQHYGFPVTPDETVTSLAYNYGMHFFKTGQVEGARYFFTILYDLTGDEVVKKTLDHLSAESAQ